MASQIFAVLASAGLVTAGFASAGETRSSAALPGQVSLLGEGQSAGGLTGDKCRVEVVRRGQPGAADVTRQVLSNGSCVCTVTTGSAAGNGSAESIVSALLRDRECNGAPSVSDNIGQQISGAASGGGIGGLVVPLVIGVGAIGLGVALGNTSNG